MDINTLTAELASRRTYDLEHPRYQGAPTFPAHEPGFLLHLHRRHELGLGEARTSASALVTMAEHNGTHIDALCHQAEDMVMYGDQEVNAKVQTSTGFTVLGVDTIPPIIRRGILLDVAAQGEIAAGEQVSAELLQTTYDRQGSSIAEGDILFVRTGNGQHFTDRARYEAGPGISPEASVWCRDLGPYAVGVDNMAWDLPGYSDPDCGTLPGHVILLIREGIFIMENCNLEQLAADGVREFCCVCLPLKMQGATGSPVRPIAIV